MPHVMKITSEGSADPPAITFLPTPPLPGKNKYYGGILTASQSIYAAPYGVDDSKVLVIDTVTDTVATLPLPPDVPPVKYGWHGGVYHEPSDRVYFFPSHADSFLVVDCGTNAVTTAGNFDQGRYKFGGGAVRGPAVYCAPSDADYLGVVTVGEGGREDVVETVPLPAEGVAYGKNKWQGGVVGSDGRIYFIPSNADKILAVNADGTIALLGDFRKGIADKFQGGAFLEDGLLYLVAENYPCSVRVNVGTGEVFEIWEEGGGEESAKSEEGDLGVEAPPSEAPPLEAPQFSAPPLEAPPLSAPRSSSSAPPSPLSAPPSPPNAAPLTVLPPGSLPYTTNPLLSLLSSNKTPHTLYTHAPAFTSAELEAFAPGLVHTKNILLKDKKHGHFLVTASHDSDTRGTIVAKALNLKGAKLRLAPESDLASLLSTEKGHVNPLSLLTSDPRSVTLVLDSRLFDAPGGVCVHPNDNSMSVEMPVTALERAAREAGVEVAVADFEKKVEPGMI